MVFDKQLFENVDGLDCDTEQRDKLEQTHAESQSMQQLIDGKAADITQIIAETTNVRADLQARTNVQWIRHVACFRSAPLAGKVEQNKSRH